MLKSGFYQKEMNADLCKGLDYLDSL